MQNAELLLKELTLEEKCALLSGAETFKTRGMPEHDIPQIWLSDGPHGLRKQAGESDHLGLNPSVPATCFPTASAVANSWDAALGEEIGAALGEEAAAQEVSVVLGPGLNMKRNPLCGRSFEYFSEDPYLAGKLAAGYIRGIQSKGVAACPKHFAVNSQETRRMASDSIVDERTLREIYLTGFEIAVKEGHPRSIMSSYNLVNGTYANENKHLLMEILRGEWGFDGAVITDWGGSNDHALGVKNGSTLEMPAPGGDSMRELLAAVESGKISESDIDARLSELLPLVFDTKAALDAAPREFDAAAHHALARRVPDYAAHEAVYFSQAITADDFAMKKNPKYVNKVVAPTLEPISSIGGFRTLPDYSFDTMPDDYVALVLIGGFGWNTPVAEKVMPIIKSAIEQEKVIGAICNAASFMAKCGIDRETTSKTLQKSSVIQKISVTLSSVIIAIIVCKLLIFNTLKLQQFFANHHFSGTYISSNSR